MPNSYLRPKKSSKPRFYYKGGGVYEKRLKLQKGIILFSSAVFYGKTQHVRPSYL